MSQSLARVVLHVVFSTKGRVAFLKDPEVRAQLHAYLAGSLRNLGCEPVIIGGTEDHVHLLCNLARTESLANLIREVKTGASRWIKEGRRALNDFAWQGGYGAFSVSESNVARVRDYVANQEEHHRKISFQEEFRALCRKHRLEIDERYVWD